MKSGDKLEVSISTVLSGVGVFVARFPTASTFSEAFVSPSQHVLRTTEGDDTVVCVLLAPDARVLLAEMFDQTLLASYGHGYASGGVWNPRAFRCDSRVVDYSHGSGWCITNAGFNRRVDNAFDSPPCGKYAVWSYVAHCNDRASEKGLTAEEIPDGSNEKSIERGN